MPEARARRSTIAKLRLTTDDLDQLIDDIRNGPTPTSPSTARSVWSVSTSQPVPVRASWRRSRPPNDRSGSPETTLPTKEEKPDADARLASYAPGYVDNDGPKIVTSRFIHEDSHPRALRGHQWLRRPAPRPRPHAGRCPRRSATLSLKPVAPASGGRQVSFMPPASSRTTRSQRRRVEPGTYKDRLHGA